MSKEVNYLVLLDLVTSEIKQMSFSLKANQLQLEAEHNNLKSSVKSPYKFNGCYKRSVNESRELIKISFYSAMIDVIALFSLLLIIVSFVRFIPLCLDLYDSGTGNIFTEKGKVILYRHFKMILTDMFYIFKFAFSMIILIVFCGSLPAYINEMPYYMGSLQKLADFTFDTAKYNIFYLFELLSFFFYFRSYRLIIKASLFGILLPAACFTEAFYTQEIDRQIRFGIGMILWAAVVIITGYVSSVTDRDTASSIPLLGVSLGIIGVMLICFCMLYQRASYRQPKSASLKCLSLTWNNLLVLAVPLFESLQLSCVVMYFFWQSKEMRDNIISSDEGGYYQYGNDSISSFVLYWGQSNRHLYSNSMILACCLVAGYGLIVSYPLAVGASETKILKVLAIR